MDAGLTLGRQVARYAIDQDNEEDEDFEN